MVDAGRRRGCGTSSRPTAGSTAGTAAAAPTGTLVASLDAFYHEYCGSTTPQPRAWPTQLDRELGSVQRRRPVRGLGGAGARSWVRGGRRAVVLPHARRRALTAGTAAAALHRDAGRVPRRQLPRSSRRCCTRPGPDRAGEAGSTAVRHPRPPRPCTKGGSLYRRMHSPKVTERLPEMRHFAQNGLSWANAQYRALDPLSVCNLQCLHRLRLVTPTWTKVRPDRVRPATALEQGPMPRGPRLTSRSPGRLGRARPGGLSSTRSASRPVVRPPLAHAVVDETGALRSRGPAAGVSPVTTASGGKVVLLRQSSRPAGWQETTMTAPPNPPGAERGRVTVPLRPLPGACPTSWSAWASPSW